MVFNNGEVGDPVKVLLNFRNCRTYEQVRLNTRAHVSAHAILEQSPSIALWSSSQTL